MKIIKKGKQKNGYYYSIIKDDNFENISYNIYSNYDKYGNIMRPYEGLIVEKIINYFNDDIYKIAPYYNFLGKVENEHENVDNNIIYNSIVACNDADTGRKRHFNKEYDININDSVYLKSIYHYQKYDNNIILKDNMLYGGGKSVGEVSLNEYLKDYSLLDIPLNDVIPQLKTTKEL